MKILTTENYSYNLDKVPETADDGEHAVRVSKDPECPDF